MGRVLGPSSYGSLGTLLGIIYLMIVPLFTVQTSITKFVSELKTKKEYGKIKYLMTRSLKVFFYVGIASFILLLLFTPKISDFLHMPILPLIIVDLILIFIFLLPVVRGIMQGMQLFKSLGINQVIEGVTKIIFGILFVYIGLGVSGAIGGILFSHILAFLFAFTPLMFLFKYKKEKFNIKDMYFYSLPVFVVMLSLTAFYSLDLILVKHFFSEVESGYYAAISLIGRTVYFATLSISFVMFPKVSELHSNNKESKHVLFKSLLLILLIGTFLILFYSIFPSFTISLFFGVDYLVIKNLIWIFALIMLLFSLIYSLALYNLSLRKIKFIYILLLFNILEVLLIYLFHNSLTYIIYGILTLMIILLLLLFVCTITYKNEKTINNNPSLQ